MADKKRYSDKAFAGSAKKFKATDDHETEPSSFEQQLAMMETFEDEMVKPDSQETQGIDLYFHR